MRGLRSPLLAALLVSVTLAAAGPPLDQNTLRLAPRRMQDYIDRGEIAGIVTLIGRGGDIAELDAVGYADIENRKPIRPDTIVQIMSQNKTFTGAAAMILVDDGLLDLTRPVQDYLPEFRGVQVAEEAIRWKPESPPTSYPNHCMGTDVS